MPASPSTASRLSRLSASCAATSPSCSGLPSALIAVCPEQYRVRVGPEASSPWLNPIPADHAVGLTAVRSTATSAPFGSTSVRTSLPANHDIRCRVFARVFRMRADRLVSLVLLLRQRGRLTADVLARELDVSPRTVLRDIEALSTAGVPVYAERGRHGGFALLPGFRTELTGLNHDEALALLVAGSRSGAQAFGLGSALASAMRKVVDALPESYRDTAAGA